MESLSTEKIKCKGRALYSEKFGIALEKKLHKATHLISSISQVALLLMVLLITIDVFLRTFLNNPISGVLEISEYLLLLIVFTQIAYAQKNKRHVCVDIVLNKLSVKYRLVIEIITKGISLLLFILISWQSFLQALVNNESSAVLSIPVSPFFLIIALGSILLALILLIDFIKLVIETKKLNLGKGPWLLFLTILFGLFVVFIVLSQPLIWGGTPVTVGIIGIVLFVIFLLLGMPVGFALAMSGFIGFLGLRNMGVALNVLGTVPYYATANFNFSAIPAFILMGEFCFFSKLSGELYHAAYTWFGRFRGGLAVTTTMACAAFGAVSGDSLSTTMTMGTVALPEMRKYKYDPGFACASIAAAGTLAVMIPPSLVFILYGLLTNQSVGKLFIAGVIPGILLTVLFSIMINVSCRINPSMGPKGDKFNIFQKFSSLKRAWPILTLFVMVILGLSWGVFTPTEAGAVGAVGALIIGLLQKRLVFTEIKASLSETCFMASMIFIILIGGEIFGEFIVLSQIPVALSNLIGNIALPASIIILIILFIYMLLGALMPAIPMIVLTVPIFFPIIIKLGYDPIWYGVLMALAFEMAVISPPVGINVYALSAIAGDVPMAQIFKGVLPFILTIWFLILLLILFPQIATFLPNLLKT